MGLMWHISTTWHFKFSNWGIIQPSKWHPLIYLGIYSTLGCYLTMHVLGKIDSLTSFAQALYNISQRCQRLRLPRHIIYRVAKIGVHEIKPFKVEKILKGSLDSIPSPSVKIQIMGGKVCLRCNGKTSSRNGLPYYLK